MNTKQKELYKVLKNKKYINGVITWNDVDGYARQYKKYDSLTLRDIDEVYNLLKIIKQI